MTATRPQRYDQCDDTCTVDCGHCKGKGRPDSFTKAADLPVGSVVAAADLVGIRHDTPPRYGNPWQMSNGGRYHDKHIDEMLAAGAQVLRVGVDAAGEWEYAGVMAWPNDGHVIDDRKRGIAVSTPEAAFRGSTDGRETRTLYRRRKAGPWGVAPEQPSMRGRGALRSVEPAEEPQR